MNEQEYINSLKDMNLIQIKDALNNLDLEVREMTDISKVREANTKRLLLEERKSELESMIERKNCALELSRGFAGRTIETSGEILKDVKKEKGFGKQLIEKRAAIASSTLLIPQLTQDSVEKKFNTVSGILDLVRFIRVGSGNKWSIPYSDTVGMGGITAEGTAATEAAPTFKNVDIDAVKITAFTQYNEECEKLPSADYESFITEEIENATNRKIIQQIVHGTGSENTQFNGLYNTDIVATTSDLSISAIDGDTLDGIIYGHNTNAEEVEGNMVLLLNKKDLGAFSKVRSNDGQRIYDIQFNETGMAGTINGTKFCICNSLNALSDSTVTKDSYTMVYCDPNKYVLPIFSDFELKKTDTIDFLSGKITVKGSVIIGGSPANPYCLTRVKKVTA